MPIFLSSGFVVLLFFAMPFIAKLPSGYAINLALTVVVLGGLAFLSWRSYAKDNEDLRYRDNLAVGHQEADRIKELAALDQKLPAAGALSLTRTDTKILGQRLFAQHCLGCHEYRSGYDVIYRDADVSAPTLYNFGTRDWVRGFVDPKQIATPDYYGKTKFAKGSMAGSVKGI